MIIRAAIAGVALAGAVSMPLAGIAVGQGDRDCRDFGGQSEAQSALRPGDPERLDADKDGIACESLSNDSSAPPGSQGNAPDAPSDSGSQLTPSHSNVVQGGSDNAAPPAGGVETGYGGAAQQGEVVFPLTVAGAATAFVTSGVMILRHRRAHRD